MSARSHGLTGGRQRWEAFLDWLFLLGVLGKAVDGALEVIVGVPLLFLDRGRLIDLVSGAATRELQEEPNQLLAQLILHEVGKLNSGVLLIGGIYLLVHGIVKLGIVTALVRGTQRLYPWAIGALSILFVVQVVDLAIKFSWGVLALTILDLVIIALTVREWRHGRSLRDVLRVRLPRRRATP